MKFSWIHKAESGAGWGVIKRVEARTQGKHFLTDSRLGRPHDWTDHAAAGEKQINGPTFRTAFRLSSSQ